MQSYEEIIKDKKKRRLILSISCLILIGICSIVVLWVKDCLYASKIINSVGLALDIIGALMVAFTLWMPLKKKAEKGKQFLSNHPKIRNISLSQYAEQKGIYMQLGLIILCFGFILQIVSNWIDIPTVLNTNILPPYHSKAQIKGNPMEPKDYFYAIGIVATAVVSVWNIINHYRVNKRSSFINTVTNERVKWLDKLRKNISDFCGLTYTWSMSNVEGKPEEFELVSKCDKLRFLIRLQLNPKEINGQPNPDKKIEELIAKVPELTHESKQQELKDALDQMIITSQELLKEEWEKVKAEAKSGDLTT